MINAGYTGKSPAAEQRRSQGNKQTASPATNSAAAVPAPAAVTNNGLDDSLLDTDHVELQLPKEVWSRVYALKNLQLKMVNIDTQFYEELHHLECKYMAMMEPLYDERVKIVTGQREPTKEESTWTLDNDSDEATAPESKVDALADELKDKAVVSGGDASATAAAEEQQQQQQQASGDKIKGIPEFWLTAIRNTDLIGEMVEEHDEPVLRHLVDIRVRLRDEKPFGFTLEFHFDEENPYFTNRVLTKAYTLTTDKDEKDPLTYDGPIIYKCQGCPIEWHAGKNVTVRLVKKKQKHKSSGQIRMVSKEEKQDSFFNFFESPTPDGVRPSFKLMQQQQLQKAEDVDEEEIDEEIEQLYESDFEIGHFFKEFLVPKSVLYFTGELVDEDEDGQYDDDDYDEDDEDGGGDNDDDDDDDDDDEDNAADEEHAHARNRAPHKKPSSNNNSQQAQALLKNRK